MQKDLAGHRAVVTGASSGIGDQYARQLAARGADLVITARRGDRLNKLAAELRSGYGVQVEVVEADLVDPRSAGKLFEAATARPVTILINNAGFGPYGDFGTTELKGHSDTIALNITSLTELCHRFVRHMREHGKRSYIGNVASIAGYQGTSYFAVYSATKAYVRVFSEILSAELAGSPISVSCLCPGGTLTEFMDIAGQTLNKGSDLVMMSSESVVRSGINGMLRGRTIVIPGLVNKLACWMPRFVPSRLALAGADLAMRRTVTRKGQALLK